VHSPSAAFFILPLLASSVASSQPISRARSTSSAKTNQSEETGIDKGEVIVVTGSLNEQPLKDSPVATEVITRAEIDASGAEDLSHLLQARPGLEVVQSFRGAGIRMQGLDPTYVLILIDGERTIGRIAGTLDISRISVENIDRVEIVKGASSALYGSDAMAGVINIITRRPDHPFEGEVHTAYGSFSTLDASARLGLAGKRWDSAFTAGWHQRDPYDLNPEDLATTSSGFQELRLTHRSSYSFSEETELNASAEYLRRDTNGVDTGIANAVFDRSTVTEAASTSLRGATRWGRQRLSGGAYYSVFVDKFLSDQRQGTEQDRYEKTREQLFQTTARHDLRVGDHLLTTGVEGTFEQLEADRLSGRGDRSRLALFAQDEWQPLNVPLLSVLPGARLDVDSQFGYHVSPKLALRFDPHPRVVLRASHGWGFRAPSFRELLLRFQNPGAGYEITGNPNLRPESSRSTTAGVELRVSRNVWASVGAFHNDIQDLISFRTVPSNEAGMMRFEYVNVASARTMGVETLVRVRPIAGLTTELGYTFTDTLDREKDRPLSGRARNMVTARVHYRLSSLGTMADAQAALSGRRVFYQDRGLGGGEEVVSTPPYVSLDLRLSQDLFDWLVLFAGVDNTFDSGKSGLMPMQPRTFYGGMTARY
jgi:outer membrane receptor for ferrienterochelin and colicins